MVPHRPLQSETMLHHRWTTDTVAAADRFAYWREAVCSTVVGAGPEGSASGEFAAEISAVRRDGRGFALFAASPHAIVRTRRHIGRAAEAPFLVSLQLAGESHYATETGDDIFAAGEIAIVDTARPFRVAFPARVSRVIAILPRGLVAARAPWLDARTVTKLGACPPCSDLLPAYLGTVARHAADLDPAAAARLIDHIADLLAFATAPQIVARADAAGGSARAWRRQATIAALMRHIGDPALTPQRAAAVAGVSLRGLHRCFEEEGVSFGRWLLERRLDTARHALGDPGLRHRSISDIAFASGFSDLSHFSRAFKARFGASPRATRAAAQSPS